MIDPLVTLNSSEAIQRIVSTLWSLLDFKKRINVILVLFLSLFTGFAETISLGAVWPFLSVLTNPESFWELPAVRITASHLGYTTADQLILPTTLLFGFLALTSSAIRMANIWFSGLVIASIGTELSSETYRKCLNQPYQVHISSNSSKLITLIQEEVNSIVSILLHILLLVHSTIALSGIVITLLLIDAQVAIGSAFLFGSFYTLIVLLSKNRLLRNGRKVRELKIDQLQILRESFGSIRDVIMYNTQPYYLSTYSTNDSPFRIYQARNRFLAQFPRLAIEGIALFIISLISCWIVLNRGGLISAIPLLGALALGTQRLMPAAQQLYSSWANITKGIPSVRALIDILSTEDPRVPDINEISPIRFNNHIRFANVDFRYQLDSPNVINNLDLTIFKGERIGFVGKTGSGKSTIIDLLMGLITPTSGTISVDSMDINHPDSTLYLWAWKNTIAHVPQSIYLSDATIAENIAFGIPKFNIDYELLKTVLANSQLLEFVKTLPQGYHTFIGERGIRLSGGQRQRIGIARALYRKATVLIFDEATSSLDNLTEEALMYSIDQLSNQLTVIMIAHRLGTLKGCDRIYKIDQGRISEISSGKSINI